MGTRTALAMTLVLFAAGPATAKDTPQSVLDDAKTLGRPGGDAKKAAERFGDALAMAQAADDLQAEQACADAIETFIDNASKTAAPAPGSKTSDAPTPSLLLAIVMRKLDANRCGAFVSAPVLARNLLEMATETGQFGSVGDAAKVASAHASRPASGRAAPVIAKYAEGLKAVADGKFEAATAPLEAAAAEAVKAGWAGLATHVTTELAAAWVHLGAPDKAAAAVTATASGLDETSGVQTVGGWLTMLAARIPSPPDAIRKPVEALMMRLKQQGKGGSGTPGSPGANAGETPKSDVAKLLAKQPKGKPFASAARSGKNVEIRWVTKPAGKTAVPISHDGIVFEQEGGVTLAVFGPSVALRLVDLENNTGGGLGGTSTPGVVRAYYLLADGETWSVSKDGVSIAH